MIKETGRVVAIDADCLWVETIRKSTCNSCSAQKGCGHGVMNKALSGKTHHVRVLFGRLSAADVAIDDEVVIAFPENFLVGGALLVYLLPLVMMLAAALLVSQWWSSDVAAFLGAVMGFAVGVAVVKVHAIMHRNDTALQPVLQGPAPSSSVEQNVPPQLLHPS